MRLTNTVVSHGASVKMEWGRFLPNEMMLYPKCIHKKFSFIMCFYYLPLCFFFLSLFVQRGGRVHTYWYSGCTSGSILSGHSWCCLGVHQYHKWYQGSNRDWPHARLNPCPIFPTLLILFYIPIMGNFSIPQ